MLNKPAMTFGNILVFGNGHEIPVISGYELTDKEKMEFDYYSEDELDSASFFRYKGQVYDLGNMESTRLCDKNHPFYRKFDGLTNDTFFSGIVVKFNDDCDAVKAYTYYCQ